LRLGFHDCLKYTDGSGGCDGCLEWAGVGHRYPRGHLEKGLVNSSSRPDGHNNGLSQTVRVLEAIYTDRSFPSKTPVLPTSPRDGGKSRADLWAFAVLEAVTYTTELNNQACDDPESLVKFNNMNQCNPRAGMDGCKVDSSRPFAFKTGRKDCTDQTYPGTFKTVKKEVHPDPGWNGPKVVDFMQTQFGFNGRETVAIMGAHTLGRVHVTVSLMRYTWKTRSAMLFNNGYFRNLARREDWYYDSYHTNKRTPCADSTLGNSSGMRPLARWMPHVRGDTDAGGPNQWLQEKFVCPTCDKLKGEKDKNQNSDRKWQQCCKNVASGEACPAGCEQWKFVSGLDETMLNSDMGLYLAFDVDDSGIPSGCEGLEDYNMESWGGFKSGGKLKNNYKTWSRINNRKAEPRCPLSKLSVPEGSESTSEVVEEYADDQAKFINDFKPALEKMLSNGYSDGDLVDAPAQGMTGFHCPAVSKWTGSRSYRCTPMQE